MRSLSLRWRVVALVLASVLAAQAMGFGLLLAFPPPPPAPMRPLQVAAALARAEAEVAPGMDRRLRSTAPFAPSTGSALAIGAVVSTLLPRSAGEVRIHVLGAAERAPFSRMGAAPAMVSTLRVSGVRGPGLSPLGPETTAALLAAVPFPAFEAALRRPDGRWLVVGPRRPFLSPWRVRVLAAFGLSALLLTPLAWASARRLTRPLQMLADAATTLGRDPGAPPLAVAGPREVRLAAAAFNDMGGRIARHLDERAGVVAAIAHDLRTPLTSLRLRAEAAPEPERARMAADIARMEAMIADLLAFVRGERLRAAPQALDLAALAAACVQDARARGLDATLDACPAAPVLGDADALRRALDNLVENAALYGERATVTVERRPAEVRVRVADDGPGLAEADCERVFAPFVRLEGSRSRATGGVGLGLSIARSIARAHGGEVALANGAQGGLDATLTVPTPSAPARA